MMAADGDGMVSPLRLPWVLRMTFWTCPDDCSYHCTHRVTNDALATVKSIKSQAKAAVWAEVEQAIKAGGAGASRNDVNERIKAKVDSRIARLKPVQKEMVQYHGKWVFIRFLGAQEPLSVLFSLANLAVHLRYIPVLRVKLPDVFPLKIVYLAHAFISANAWVWSSVFHARDKPLTEKLDYFSAGAAILSGFFFTISRLYRLSPGNPRFSIFLKICSGALLLHILYLCIIPRFDYSYNMAVNVTLALGHNLLWLAYSFFPGMFPDGSSDPYRATRTALRTTKQNASGLSTPTKGSPPAPVLARFHLPSTSKKARRRLRLIVLLLTLAAGLELLDFPPLGRALDAHALWHLSTVPISLMWYEWMIRDAQECVSSGYWIGDPLESSGRGVSRPVLGALGKATEWAKTRAGPIGAHLERNTGSLELAALTERLSGLAGKAGLKAGIRRRGADGGEHGNGKGKAVERLSSDLDSGNGTDREKLSDEIEGRIGA
jgi:hypothetical protein